MIYLKVIPLPRLYVGKSVRTCSGGLTSVLSEAAGKSTHWRGLRIRLRVKVVESQLRNWDYELVQGLCWLHERFTSLIHHWVRLTILILKLRAVHLIDSVPKSVNLWLLVILKTVVLPKIIDLDRVGRHLWLCFRNILDVHNHFFLMVVLIPWHATWVDVLISQPTQLFTLLPILIHIFWSLVLFKIALNLSAWISFWNDWGSTCSHWLRHSWVDSHLWLISSPCVRIHDLVFLLRYCHAYVQIVRIQLEHLAIFLFLSLRRIVCIHF